MERFNSDNWRCEAGIEEFGRSKFESLVKVVELKEFLKELKCQFL